MQYIKCRYSKCIGNHRDNERQSWRDTLKNEKHVQNKIRKKKKQEDKKRETKTTVEYERSKKRIKINQRERKKTRK